MTNKAAALWALGAIAIAAMYLNWPLVALVAMVVILNMELE